MHGRGASDLGVQIWVLGFDHAAPWLLWPEQGSALSATMLLNKSRTGSCISAYVVPIPLHLPLSDQGGEGKEMTWAVMCKSSGGGCIFTSVHLLAPSGGLLHLLR
jgi:hypothetical protein